MDGSATLPEPGDYVGIYFTEGASEHAPGRGNLAYVHARYGGHGGPCACTIGPMIGFGGAHQGNPTSAPSSISHSTFEDSETAAVEGWGAILQVTDSVFVSNADEAISATQVGDAHITGNFLSNNGEGIVTSGDGSPVIAENTIEDCTGYGISRTLGGNNDVGTVSIHDNVVERCGSSNKPSIYVWLRNTTPSSPVSLSPTTRWPTAMAGQFSSRVAQRHRAAGHRREHDHRQRLQCDLDRRRDR